MPQSFSPPRIAYLTGQYPLVSLTFIQREIESLRALGMQVQTCSIRQTPVEQHKGAAEKAAAAETFYVLKAARNPIRLAQAQLHLLRRPRRYFKTLALAIKTAAPGVRAFLYQLFFFAEATVLAQHLRREKITHLHNHFVTGSATVAMLASELTDIPYSFTLHGPADLFEPYRWQIAAKTARARFVATISHFARSQIMFFSDPVHWGKIRIIHCGVVPERYASSAGAPLPARQEDELRLLFVGRLAPVKGLRILLKAMHGLIEEIPRLHLVLVGDGPDRALLEEAAAPLGAHVTFTGYLSQDEVVQAMQGCDIFVLPSFAEGVPVVLMEALANAKPVIATRVAGVSELVEDGENGYLVAPGDPVALAGRIRTLAQDAQTRARMGAKGRDIVTREFDIRTEAARLATLFVHGPQATLRPEPMQHHPGNSLETGRKNADESSAATLPHKDG